MGNRCLSYSFQTFAHVISRILVSVTIQRIILVFQTEVQFTMESFFFFSLINDNHFCFGKQFN